MNTVARGIVNLSGPAGNRLSSSFPCVTVLPGGRVLATYRVGSTKDSDDETIELRYSDDLGAHWSEPQSPFPTTVLLLLCYKLMTRLDMGVGRGIVMLG